MSTQPLVLLNIVLLGLVLWLGLKPEPQPEPSDDVTESDSQSATEIAQLRLRIEQLERDLDNEIAARINEQEARLFSQPGSATGQDGENFNNLASTNQFESSEPDPIDILEEASVETRLVNVGIPRETAQAMKAMVDQNQLDMLRLRDRAIREGWRDSDEYREQAAELRNPYRKLRDEFGDEAFDQYLYANDIPNRVQVQEVYTGSAADNAGLRPGDIVVSYNADTIYSMSSLRDSTLEGFVGENILLDVNRDGQMFTTTVPRGPLGISMTSIVMNPDAF